ncbi:MAG: hypothetical protein HUJ25_03140 [Crocinitomicaceae bacterium]|nr:hypothetical protein [Crocinitomicaceae bacterium]
MNGKSKAYKGIGIIHIIYSIIQFLACSFFFVVTGNHVIVVPVLIILFIFIMALLVLQEKKIPLVVNLLVLLVIAFKPMYNYQLTHKLNVGFRYEFDLTYKGYGFYLESLSFLFLSASIIVWVMVHKRRTGSEEVLED